MSGIAIKTFAGVRPRIDPLLLADNEAQTSINTKLWSGALAPFDGKLLVYTPTKAGTQKTIYRFGKDVVSDTQYWFTWPSIVSVVRGPIADDTSERSYYTGDGAPKMTNNALALTGGTQYPVTWYDLGIPAPVTPPTAVAGSIPSYSISSLTSTGTKALAHSAAHKLTGPTYVTVSGATPNTYNGRVLATPAGPDDFTYDIPTTATSPATGTITYTIESSATSTAYVYTYVSAYGEEGPPSQPSSVIGVYYGQSVALSAMATGPSGAHNIVSKRIYRASTGDSGTDYLFVAEIALANTTYSDTKLGTELGSLIPSKTWTPPRSTLEGLISLPNGGMAAFSGKTLCFCEPNRPWAWPVDYEESVPDTIMGIGSFGSTVVVTTTGLPWLAIGTDPASVSMTEVNEDGQACISKTSVANIPDGVAYSCPDGIAVIGVGGSRVASLPWLTKDQWEKYNPTSIHAYGLNGRYIGFYDATSIGGSKGGFIFDPSAGGSGLIFTDLYATAGYVEQQTNELYLLLEDGKVYKWDADANNPMTLSRKSKVYPADYPTGMSIAQVIAVAYPVTFKLYADGTLVHTQTVADKNPFRLPDLAFGLLWEVEVISTKTVRQVLVGETVANLRGV